MDTGVAGVEYRDVCSDKGAIDTPMMHIICNANEVPLPNYPESPSVRYGETKGV